MLKTYAHSSRLRTASPAQLAVAIVLFIAGLAAAPAAQAMLFTYQFLPGTTATLNGITETITGSFTFDSSTNTLPAVDITLSGASPYSMTYSYDFNIAGWNSANCVSGCIFTIGVSAVGTNNNAGRLLALQFAGELGVSPVASMGPMAAYNDPGIGNVFSTATTGGVTLIPEPGTALLFASGLVGLALHGRRPRAKVSRA